MIITRMAEPGKAPTTDSDPTTVAEFDTALTSVSLKYQAGIPLTRAELTRLVNATLAVIKREVACK